MAQLSSDVSVMVNLNHRCMETKVRYSDEELQEFRAIINDKLAVARESYSKVMRRLMNQDTNDVDDTSPTYKALEEGSLTQSKEQLVEMAARHQKFIQGLEAALIRIDNKTYGNPSDRCVGCQTVVRSLQHPGKVRSKQKQTLQRRT